MQKRGWPQSVQYLERIGLLIEVLYKVLLDWLSRAVDPLLRREQAGFRPKRIYTDQITTLRIIMEEASEWQREVYLNFVKKKLSTPSDDLESGPVRMRLVFCVRSGIS